MYPAHEMHSLCEFVCRERELFALQDLGGHNLRSLCLPRLRILQSRGHYQALAPVCCGVGAGHYGYSGHHSDRSKRGRGTRRWVPGSLPMLLPPSNCAGVCMPVTCAGKGYLTRACMPHLLSSNAATPCAGRKERFGGTEFGSQERFLVEKVKLESVVSRWVASFPAAVALSCTGIFLFLESPPRPMSSSITGCCFGVQEPGGYCGPDHQHHSLHWGDWGWQDLCASSCRYNPSVSSLACLHAHACTADVLHGSMGCCALVTRHNSLFSTLHAGAQAKLVLQQIAWKGEWRT
jgi:hypothetical protein